MTRTIVRAATIALAIAALAAPTAVARPDAAAPVALEARRPRTAQGRRQPFRDTPDPRPEPRAAERTLLAAGDRLGRTCRPRHRLGDDFGIGIAGSLLAVGAIALITNRMRHPRIAAGAHGGRSASEGERLATLRSRAPRWWPTADRYRLVS